MIDPDFVPESVSAQVRAAFPALLSGARARNASRWTPRTQADFDAQAAAREADMERLFGAQTRALTNPIAERVMAGVPVLEVLPPTAYDPSAALIYVHGGAYILLSARSTVGAAARLATKNARRVVSVDYTLAPRADWQAITGQVMAVFEALIAEGCAPDRIAIIGDSAGGGIVNGAVLRLRDAGRPLPVAVVLVSPTADLTMTGETMTTMRPYDAMLDLDSLRAGYDAYRGSTDAALPYISPVFADFAPGFPPTLIQVGTREILLSDSVRLYRAICGGGGDARLDVYEGMPHSFAAIFPSSPESETAIDTQRHFLDKHLGRSGR